MPSKGHLIFHLTRYGARKVKPGR